MRKYSLTWSFKLIGIILFSMTFIPDSHAIEGRCVPTPPCYCKEECFRCGPGGCSKPSSPSYKQQPSYDYEAERQRQLEAERQRQQEIEAEKKREEEANARKKAEFEKNKREALQSMKGISGGEMGLKDVGSSGGLGLKGTGSGGSLGLKKIDDIKAVKEAQSNLYHTQQGKPGSVFDTRDVDKSVPLITVPGTGQPIQLSDKARKDQRMIKELKELTDLQAKRQKLDAERTKLTTERNSTKDPEKMKKLTEKLDIAEKDYQNNLLTASKTYENVEKLKRTIDAEVEKPASSGQSTKGSGK